MEGVDKFVGIDPDLWEHRLDELDPLSAPGWRYLSQKTLPWQAAVEDDRRRLVQQVAALYEDIDLLLTPMASVPPFAAEGPMPTEVDGREVHAGMSVVLGFLASVVNLPALSVPAGLDPSRPPGRPPGHRPAPPRGPRAGRRRPLRARPPVAPPLPGTPLNATLLGLVADVDQAAGSSSYRRAASRAISRCRRATSASSTRIRRMPGRLMPSSAIWATCCTVAISARV